MLDRDLGKATTEQLGPALWVLHLTGEHDLSTAPGVSRALKQIEQSGTTVVVDLTNASFIDSSVVGALVKQQQRGENLLLVAPKHGAIRRSLDLLGITTRFKTFDTRAAALEAVPPEDQPTD
jgi:anti-anti-sigma factor